FSAKFVIEMDYAQNETELRARISQQREQGDRIGTARDGGGEFDARTKPAGRLQGCRETAFQFFGEITALHTLASFSFDHRTKQEWSNRAALFGKKRRPGGRPGGSTEVIVELEVDLAHHLNDAGVGGRSCKRAIGRCGWLDGVDNGSERGFAQ